MISIRDITKIYIQLIKEDIDSNNNLKSWQRALKNDIGDQYNEKDNTIDLQYNPRKPFRFKNEYLNENGTFDYIFINWTNNGNNMFKDCTKLKSIPESFIIPNDINIFSFSDMFNNCTSLIEIPNTFILPNSTTSCVGMFSNCTSLKTIPESFIIPKKVSSCREMFSNCTSLSKIPDNFILPNNVKHCQKMFSNCTSLSKLPDNFTIPYNVYDCHEIFNNCKSLLEIPNGFKLNENIKYCNDMFSGCSSLTSLPNNFIIPLKGVDMFKDCTSLIIPPDLLTEYNNIQKTHDIKQLKSDGIQLHTTNKGMLLSKNKARTIDGNRGITIQQACDVFSKTQKNVQ